MAPPKNLPDNVRSRCGPFTDQKLASWVQDLRLYFTKRACRDLIAAVVELAQNIQRHGLEPAEAVIDILPHGDLWEVCAQNFASRNMAGALERQLEALQNCGKDHLRDLFRQKLKGADSAQGAGAGVGLLTLVRLSRLPVEWERIPLAQDREQIKVRVFVALLDMKDLPPLDMPATEVTPRVHFDPAARTLSFSGDSFPEDVANFYQPVQEWLTEYLQSGEPLYLEFCLDYINTSSTKALEDLFEQVESRVRAGGQIAVHWVAASETSLETGEDLLHGFRFPHRISGPNTTSTT